MSQSTPDAASTKRTYKKSLNLPRTTFPMKANLVQNEPASVKRWQNASLYQRISEAGKDRFIFHDGPPYANGSIHLGHLLNKCLKDFVVRSRTMAGMQCPYIPGWDCHGLPIEHKVMSELVESGRIEKIAALPDDKRRLAIRNACKKDAEKYVKLQTKQMANLLTLADYDNPYVTMDPAYEAAVLEVFAEMVRQGLVHRDLKPVHWSIANETALAEAELEYFDRKDRSVYVEFEAQSREQVEQAFGLEPGSLDQTPSFMIWTTTPWTLPANLAVAVHERIDYALVKINDSLTVIASDLISSVAAKAGVESVKPIAKAPGKRLLGLSYRHPFIDTADLAAALSAQADLHRIVGAEYVTIEDGTGLVHTAPGHGVDDYHTGLREHLPIYCPVKGDGLYDHTAPAWLQGVSVWDANDTITERLRESGRLFAEETITHSYPHDWRGKSPVIFRATEQWFVCVDKPAKRDNASLRQLALEAADNTINFVPQWGRNRMRGMLETRPDWCISRQRAWGLPIPAFHAPDGSTLLTAAAVEAVAKVIGERGSDAWFTQSPAELLRHYEPATDPDAPKGLDIAALTKSGDIFDVWFESGSSWNAVMRRLSQGRDYPVDLYLEGSDQHRGWFQLSLLCGLGMTGKPPFKTLLTHGFIVDKDGKKMSKSLGNTLEVEAILSEFGADVARWWISSLSYENDIKADLSFFTSAGESYRKVRNTLRFMLSNLGDFIPSPPGADSACGEGMCVNLAAFSPTSIDAWALAKFDALSASVRAAYERYDFKAAHSLLYDFCNDTLSSIYLAAAKDRLYCDHPDSDRRRRTQTTLWELIDGLCSLLAPMLPHTADEAFRSLHRVDKSDNETSVHTRQFIEGFGVKVDPGWDDVMKRRDEAMIALEQLRATGGVENPLDAGLNLPDPDAVLARFDAADIADVMGVSRITLDPGADEILVLDLRQEPRCERCWKRDGSVEQRSDGGMLSQRDAVALGLA